MQKFLITGASGGIGRALAERLVTRGAQLALSSRTLRRLEGIADGATLLPADLIVPSEAARVVDAARDALGGLDCVVHLAGVGLIKSAATTTDAEFSRIVNVNLRTTFLVAQAACRIMEAQKRGLFLTIPGILGKAPMKNAAAYIASKYGVTGLIKAFAQEYQRSGVRFGLFFFGGVDTPFWDQLDLKVQADKMIPASTAADILLQAIDAPPHLVLSEVVLQPESHQLV